MATATPTPAKKSGTGRKASSAAKPKRDVAEVLRTAKITDMKPGDLSQAQTKRAESAPKGMTGKALATFVLEGKTAAEQQKEAKAAREAKERAEKRQNRSAAQTKGGSKSKGGEALSEPMFPKAKSDSYVAYMRDGKGDEANLVFIGVFEASTRKDMAAKARTKLAKSTSKAKADAAEIVSFRPRNVRVTPAAPKDGE